MQRDQTLTEFSKSVQLIWATSREVSKGALSFHLHDKHGALQKVFAAPAIRKMRITGLMEMAEIPQSTHDEYTQSYLNCKLWLTDKTLFLRCFPRFRHFRNASPFRTFSIHVFPVSFSAHSSGCTRVENKPEKAEMRRRGRPSHEKGSYLLYKQPFIVRNRDMLIRQYRPLFSDRCKAEQTGRSLCVPDWNIGQERTELFHLSCCRFQCSKWKELLNWVMSSWMRGWNQ